MPTPHAVYKRLPVQDKRTIAIYMWMTILTVGLVLFFVVGQSKVGEETANRAKSVLHNAVKYNCEETNTRNEKAKAVVKAGGTNGAEKRAIINQLQPPRDCKRYVYDRDHGLRYEVSSVAQPKVEPRP